VPSKPNRQAARPATNFEHPGALGGNYRDVGSNAVEQRAEQEPAQHVIDARIPDEDASWHLMASGGMAATSHDGDSRDGQEQELPRSTHHNSTSIRGQQGYGILVTLPG
jgi:hypothetical protein